MSPLPSRVRHYLILSLRVRSRSPGATLSRTSALSLQLRRVRCGLPARPEPICSPGSGEAMETQPGVSAANPRKRRAREPRALAGAQEPRVCPADERIHARLFLETPQAPISKRSPGSSNFAEESDAADECCSSAARELAVIGRIDVVVHDGRIVVPGDVVEPDSECPLVME